VCIQKFPDWLLGAITENGTALCHCVQLYRYFVSQSSERCRHNPFCCFSTSVYCCKRIFHYQLSPETLVYTIVQDFIQYSSLKVNSICRRYYCALRNNRLPTHKIFYFRHILKKKRENNGTVHQLFIDFKNAYDSGEK
jgi:hypothetical protein